MTTFASYDDTTLAYRTIGSGPVLVCLPGGPGRNADYLENLAGLDASNTLLLLDSRGTGASALPTDDFSYSAESLARDVEALREHLGVEKLRLLGHSAGAVVALHYAAGFSERIERLVLVTTAITPAERADRDAIAALRSGEPWYPAARDAWDGLPYARSAELVRLEREIRPFWYGAWGEREQQHAASAEHQTAPRARARFAVTPSAERAERLRAFGVPTLVITGGLDAMTPPSYGQAVAAAILGAELVELAGAGHFPWVDRPAAFRAAVGSFFDQS